MKKQAEQIVKRLKSKKLRVTPQRFAIYSNLLERQDHPTAEQILLELNKESFKSSQATVYSSLQALQEVGLVKQVLLEEGVCRYDANTSAHHHFCCQKCGHIEDIPWDALPDIKLSKLRPGLEVKGYEVVVYGICDRCD